MTDSQGRIQDSGKVRVWRRWGGGDTNLKSQEPSEEKGPTLL